ncbi:hypothetical protein [Streptomyces acidiscabies]|nr:hypothetical protein [Streptomyces acidiscabies]
MNDTATTLAEKTEALFRIVRRPNRRARRRLDHRGRALGAHRP